MNTIVSRPLSSKAKEYRPDNYIITRSGTSLPVDEDWEFLEEVLNLVHKQQNDLLPLPAPINPSCTYCGN